MRQQPMQGMKSRWAIRVIVSLVVGGGVILLGLRLLYPDDPLTLCQKVLDSGFEQWLVENGTNSYPNIGGDERASFAAVGEYIPDSQAYQAKYGYVPGLKDDDPPDLVMLYLRTMTRKTWNGASPGSILKEPRWMVIGPSFGGDLPEMGELETTDAFRARLQKTLIYLQEQDRPYWTNVVAQHGRFLDALHEE